MKRKVQPRYLVPTAQEGTKDPRAGDTAVQARFAALCREILAPWRA